ncbi:MAG: hypothetical protein Q9170_000645 [Blastenia crenularia]
MCIEPAPCLMENAALTADGQPPATKSDPETLRILCFGDSLTAGYSRYGYFHYPYAKQIREKLKEKLPGTEATVDVSGLSGDRVIDGEFLIRMEEMCAKAKDAPYDWIIVLGGTNDLGWDEGANDIYDGLKKVWRVALDTGANVLVLSILEAAYTAGDILQRRKELNSLVACHEEKRLYYLDLCAAVPYFTMNSARRELIWDDGLHLTLDGYEMMGDAVAKRLLELLPIVAEPRNVNRLGD